MATAAEATAAPAAAEFVERFSAAWADPSPERLLELTHPDVVLIQPGMPRLEGTERARRGWARLFALWPDLRAEVDRWSATGDYVFIDFRLRATVGRRPFEWPAVDRVLLENGLVRERVSYFDPLPLMLESLKRPSKLPATVRLMRGAYPRGSSRRALAAAHASPGSVSRARTRTRTTRIPRRRMSIAFTSVPSASSRSSSRQRSVMPTGP